MAQKGLYSFVGVTPDKAGGRAFVNQANGEAVVLTLRASIPNAKAKALKSKTPQCFSDTSGKVGGIF